MKNMTPTQERLAALRERIHASGVPAPAPGKLRIATWNIRELGRRPRRPESLLYIAEILSRFDLVSIVELRENLAELEVSLGHLGPDWRALFTSPVFDAGGNRERAAYVYNARRVRHTGLASSAQAPRTKQGAEYLASIGWWRAPFIASFNAGDAELLLLTAHIRWGDSAAARLSELTLLANWIATEIAKDPFCGARDVVALGDFNIPNDKSPLLAAIRSRGLVIPEALLGTHGTNLARDKRYDQILHLPASASAFTGKGGAVDFYTGGIGALYPDSIDEREFTYELSDHLPLWVQITTRKER